MVFFYKKVRGNGSHLFLDTLKLFPKLGIVALELLYSSVNVLASTTRVLRGRVKTHEVAFSCFALIISLRAIAS
jgi:hypothetical protein